MLALAQRSTTEGKGERQIATDHDMRFVAQNGPMKCGTRAIPRYAAGEAHLNEVRCRRAKDFVVHLAPRRDVFNHCTCALVTRIYAYAALLLAVGAVEEVKG